MNPLTGRFWTADDYEGSQSDPASLHKYIYGNGDGTNASDPSGHFSTVELAIGNVITSTINSMAIDAGRKTLQQGHEGMNGQGGGNYGTQVFENATVALDVLQLGNDIYLCVNLGKLATIGTIGVVKGAKTLWRKMTTSVEKAFVSLEANFGKNPSKDYRKTFFEANPELEGKVVVHHAVEQQTLARYSDVVTSDKIHSLENLRGIPKEINSEIHLSEIRKIWNKFYKTIPSPTEEQLLQQATLIDDQFGHLFNPPVR